MVYPFVKQLRHLNAIAVNPLPLPTGVTVHYSADPDFERVVNCCLQSKLGYHAFIDATGDIYQMNTFDKTTNHAGRATWNNQSPNRSHIAICLLGWGRLTKREDGTVVSWTNTAVAKDAIRTTEDGRLWAKFTQAQEDSLVAFLKWAMAFGVKPTNICGHDECALPAGRKDDPGGSLSTSMEMLRRKLAAEVGAT